MKIQKLCIQNFYSYGNAAINLADRGLVLVEGRNTDTGGSNGAGKSALFEALCFGLFGKTLRYGSSLSEVTRNGNGDTVVYLEILSDQGLLLVYRHREHSKYGNKTLLYVNGKDLSRGSESETQKVINDFLQLDFETFCSVVLFPQDAMGFSSLNDASQKSVLESLLGFQRFSDAQERAREQAKKLSSAKSSLEATIAELSRTQDEKKRHLENLKDHEARFEQEKKSRLQSLQERLSSLLEKEPKASPELLAEYEQTKAKAFSPQVSQARQLEAHSRRRIQDTYAELAKVRGNIEILERGLSDFQGEAPPIPEASIQTLAEDYQRLSTQKAKIDNALLSKQEDLKNLDYVLSDIDRQTVCQTCKQPLSGNAKKHLLGSSGERRAKLASEISQLSSALRDLEPKLSIAEGLYYNALSYEKWEDAIQKQKELNSKIQERDSLTARIDSLNSSLNSVLQILQLASLDVSKTESLGNQIAEIEQQAKLWQVEVSHLRQELDKVSAEVNPHTPLIASLEESIQVAGKLILSKLAAALELEKQISILEYWIFGFGNKGVKSLLLDTVTPTLSAAASDYLSFLSDGAASVEFKTQTELQSGEKRDKFNVSVSYKCGAKTYRGVSGGERQRVDTATMFALGDLAANRVSAPVKLRLLDESFCYMDASSVEVLVRLLREKVVPKCGTCLVMTHSSDLKALFDNHIVVVKEGGVSRIEDLNEA